MVCTKKNFYYREAKVEPLSSLHGPRIFFVLNILMVD